MHRQEGPGRSEPGNDSCDNGSPQVPLGPPGLLQGCVPGRAEHPKGRGRRTGSRALIPILGRSTATGGPARPAPLPSPRGSRRAEPPRGACAGAEARALAALPGGEPGRRWPRPRAAERGEGRTL